MLMTIENLLAVPLDVGYPFNVTLTEAGGSAPSVTLGVSERDLLFGEDQGDPAYKRLNRLKQIGSLAMSVAEDPDTTNLLDLGVNTPSATLNATLDTNVSATAEVVRAVVKSKGLLTEVTSVISAVLATGDLTLDVTKNGGASLGLLTVTEVGSAAGDVDTLVLATPEPVVPGDVIEMTAGGANTGAGKAELSLKIEPRV